MDPWNDAPLPDDPDSAPEKLRAVLDERDSSDAAELLLDLSVLIERHPRRLRDSLLEHERRVGELLKRDDAGFQRVGIKLLWVVGTDTAFERLRDFENPDDDVRELADLCADVLERGITVDPPHPDQEVNPSRGGGDVLTHRMLQYAVELCYEYIREHGPSRKRDFVEHVFPTYQSVAYPYPKSHNFTDDWGRRRFRDTQYDSAENTWWTCVREDLQKLSDVRRNGHAYEIASET